MSAAETLAAATIGDLATRPPATVGTDTPMWKVVAEMKSKGRGAALVEQGGALVGIFTERDLLNRIDHADPLWSHVLVGDVMTAHPMVIHRDDTLAEAVRRLVEGRRRHMPVVDEQKRILGLVSIRDILAYIAQKFPEELVNLPPEPRHES